MVARWRVLIVLPLLGALISYAASYAIAPTFTATTSFVSDSPDKSSNLGAFASVASQLGVGLAASPTSSPQFFGDVLHSNEIMGRVLQSRIPSPTLTRGDSVTVRELYSEPRATTQEWDDRALQKMRKKLDVSVNPRTGIIELRIGAPDPKSAVFIARRFVETLNAFNLNTRQSQARQRRRFTGERLREAQDSLARAEAAQQAFLQSNRSYRGAPGLEASFERLQRQISVYQELYSTLRRDYETARINEVNDTPVITVVEHPTEPLKRSAPNRFVMAAAGATLAAFIALGWLLAVSFSEQLRLTRPENHARLRALRGTFLRSLGLGRRREPELPGR